MVNSTGEEQKVRRILHFRFTLPDVAPEMLAMVKSTAPFFQMFGTSEARNTGAKSLA